MPLGLRGLVFGFVLSENSVWAGIVPIESEIASSSINSDIREIDSCREVEFNKAEAQVLRKLCRILECSASHRLGGLGILARHLKFSTYCKVLKVISSDDLLRFHIGFKSVKKIQEIIDPRSNEEDISP